MHIGPKRHGEEVRRAAAPAKTGDSKLTGRDRLTLEIARAVDHVGAQLCLIEARLKRAAIVVVTRIAADRRQSVRRKREEASDRCTARHILDVGIEPAV